MPASPLSPDSAAKARADALRLLKFRPRSEAELRERLGRKGFSAEVVDPLMENLRRARLIDDARFARYYVTQKLGSKPSGRRALLADLKARGIEPGLASQAVEDGTEGVDELETARRLAQARMNRLRGLEPEAVQRRLFGFLSRRGFSADAVYRAVREAAG